MTEHLYPSEAGFDGTKGFRIPVPGVPDYRVQLTRGSKPPSQCVRKDWCEQLFWWTPEGELPHLLWCNESGQWFDLTFTPIEKP